MEARFAMKWLSKRRDRGAVGASLAADRLVAVLPPGGADEPSVWVRPLNPSSRRDEPWSDLVEALHELRAAAGAGGHRLYVALMPPLAHVRCLTLPGLTEDEASRLVARDVSRFLPARDTQLIAEVQGTGRRRGSPFLFVGAPSALLEVIADAARSTGWSLGGCVSATLAWAAVASPASSRDEEAEIVVCLTTHVELLRLRRGFLAEIRRLPISAAERTQTSLRELLAERGIELAVGAISVLSPDEAAMHAARFARQARPRLLPAAEQLLVRRRSSRASTLRFVAAAVLLASGGVVETWGVARDRTRIANTRRQLRANLEQAIAVRESLAIASERLGAVRAMQVGGRRWSAQLAGLAERLPADAYLVSLDATSDSIHLEGAAARASTVFGALAAVPGLSNIRPEGPIRQDLHGGDAGMEHFALAARLSGYAAPPVAAGVRVPNDSGRRAQGWRP